MRISDLCPGAADIMAAGNPNSFMIHLRPANNSWSFDNGRRKLTNPDKIRTGVGYNVWTVRLL